jgi:methyl-accepting chemotaxis protein
MDFDGAIQAHSSWKLKIYSAARNGNKDRLDAVAVGKDNACALGQWIHGEGKTLMVDKPDYQELVRLHSDFHRQAASLISKIDKGQTAEVEAALSDRNSPYSSASMKIISLLMKFRSAK